MPDGTPTSHVPTPAIICERTARFCRQGFWRNHRSGYLAALARSRSGVRGSGAVLREFHGLGHEALGPALTPGQAATSSRLLFALGHPIWTVPGPPGTLTDGFAKILACRIAQCAPKKWRELARETVRGNN